MISAYFACHLGAAVNGIDMCVTQKLARSRNWVEFAATISVQIWGFRVVRGTGIVCRRSQRDATSFSKFAGFLTSLFQKGVTSFVNKSSFHSL